MDFGVGVHHKRPMAHDRFVDRLAAEDQQHGVVIGFKADARAITLKQRKLPFTHHVLTVDLDRPMQHHQRSVAARVQIQRSRLARIQADIPHVDRRKGMGRAAFAIELTGNQAQTAGIVLERQVGDVTVDDALIPRRGHFVLCRQVDP